MFADMERRIMMLNPAMETLFGYREKELLGRKAKILYSDSEDYAKQGSIRFNHSAVEKLTPYEVKYCRKDGTVFLSETVGSVIKDEKGNKIGFFALIRDITSRKQMEDKLRELEDKYRTVADFTYDWEIWVNPDGSYRYVSPSCERITGYTVTQFMEQPGLLRKIVVPDDRPIWDKHHHEAGKECKLREIQFRIVRKDGEISWIESACMPVLGKGNEFLGCRASNRDITKRKRIEKDLQSALAKIERYKEQLEAESAYLSEEISLACNYENIIGCSNALQYVIFKIEQIAATDTSVLILGETGTGKELIARAIHMNSCCSDRPMLKIDCTSLPANLIESELFGHERGAFTDAHAKRIGRFEAAHGATIFLDEIGELPLALQAKLLRVLQDGEFERIGSSKTTKVDVRVIAATNRNLEQDINDGLFRKDLWYRLNVFPITAPPLRDRLEDIPLLVTYFMEIFARKQGKNVTIIPQMAIGKLQQYSWPGNVRELENVIERAVINSTGNRLQLVDELDPQKEMESTFKSMEEVERDHIIQVLEQTNWKVSGQNSAAEILKLNRSTLRARMKKLHINKSTSLT
ncbi:MAG: sigma 54-interacting transcriptional regulator [Deltaproteobacteria bacterium]|nr:sigma 54-interacting transcriptional regulator [Deltaproteobacteria bacterium]